MTKPNELNNTNELANTNELTSDNGLANTNEPTNDSGLATTNAENQLTVRTTSNLLAFLRGLRELGFQIGSDEEQMAVTSLDVVGWDHSTRCREAVAAVVVKNPQEYPLFTVAWQQFWLLLRRPADSFLHQQTIMSSIMRQKAERHRHPNIVWMGQAEDKKNEDPPTNPADPFSVFLKGAATKEEVLRHKEFTTMTDEELQELLQFRLSLQPVLQRSHRWSVGRDGRNLNLSATLRNSAGSPEVLELIYHQYQMKPRRVVLLCDVSGSMDPYSRVLLRFAHVLCMNNWDIEVFVLSTRLTRVTRWLQLSDSNDALAAVTAGVPHMSGGTRLAQTLQHFHADYARTLLHQGTIVILATDGLDTGQPEELQTALLRLSRLSSHLIWLNPLVAHPGYEPTARGARTIHALVDDVLPAHNFAALETSWRRVTQLPRSRPVRRQQI